MIIDFIIEDLMLNSYLQKNFHTLKFADTDYYLLTFFNLRTHIGYDSKYLHISVLFAASYLIYKPCYHNKTCG